MKYTVFKMTFEKFNVTLQEKQEIKDALISHNLYKTSEKPSFIKICDTLEEAQEELCHWDSYWAHINYGVPFERITQYYIANEDGGRIAPVREFYLGPGRVDLHPGEVLTHVVIPKKEYAGYHGHYIKYSMRNAMDIATLSCSVVSKIDTAKNILEDVRITFGVAAPVPYRCVETEEKLKGRTLDEGLYQELEESVRGEIHPRDSWRASRDFRLQIGGEIAKRALIRTAELAGEDTCKGGEEA